MDIKVEEYVRTKSGFIGKVIGRHGGYGLHYELDVNKEIQENFMNGIVHEDNIIKHSFNLVDLIEVGDTINKEYMSSYMDIYVRFIRDKQKVKSILTHQQFEANCYKVKEQTND